MHCYTCGTPAPKELCATCEPIWGRYFTQVVTPVPRAEIVPVSVPAIPTCIPTWYAVPFKTVVPREPFVRQPPRKKQRVRSTYVEDGMPIEHTWPIRVSNERMARTLAWVRASDLVMLPVEMYHSDY